MNSVNFSALEQIRIKEQILAKIEQADFELCHFNLSERELLYLLEVSRDVRAKKKSEREELVLGVMAKASYALIGSVLFLYAAPQITFLILQVSLMVVLLSFLAALCLTAENTFSSFMRLFDPQVPYAFKVNIGEEVTPRFDHYRRERKRVYDSLWSMLLPTAVAAFLVSPIVPQLSLTLLQYCLYLAGAIGACEFFISTYQSLRQGLKNYFSVNEAPDEILIKRIDSDYDGKGPWMSQKTLNALKSLQYGRAYPQGERLFFTSHDSFIREESPVFATNVRPVF